MQCSFITFNLMLIEINFTTIDQLSTNLKNAIETVALKSLFEYEVSFAIFKLILNDRDTLELFKIN